MLLVHIIYLTVVSITCIEKIRCRDTSSVSTAATIDQNFDITYYHILINRVLLHLDNRVCVAERLCFNTNGLFVIMAFS